MGENQDSLRNGVPAERNEVELTDDEKRREEVLYSAVSVLLSEVPILGSVFNELRTHRAQRDLETRLRTLEQELTQQMEGVREDAVNWDYLDSEVFRDSMRKAVEISLRTRDREKIAFVAQILRGAVLSFEQNAHSAAEEYLYLVSDLTPQELRVALSAYKQRPSPEQDEAWTAWAENTSNEIGLDVTDVRFALGRIVAAGLLDKITAVRTEEGIAFHTPSEIRTEVGLYQITPAFEKLMRFVEQERDHSN